MIGNRKVVTNPKTGKMETIQDNSEEQAIRKLRETKKELRDMLDGNVQFHEDKLGPTKPDVKEAKADWTYVGTNHDGSFINGIYDGTF